MITKEKALKILNINCLKDKEGKQKLINLLSKTKWFKGKDVNFETMQKLYDKLEEKYNFCIGAIVHTKRSYDVSVIRRIEVEYTKAVWIETVYAYDLEELFIKVLLLMYFSIVEGLKFKDAEEKEVINGGKRGI